MPTNAAFTIVMNDMVILKLWISYYKKHFDKLHVILNGTKDEYIPFMDQLTKELPLTYERVKGFAGNSDQTVTIIRETQKKLLEGNRWVLYADCDEVIVADPEKYTGLRDFMEKCDREKVACVAYDVIQAEDEKPIDYEKPYFEQRKFWFKDPDYNKTLLARVPLNWVPGCHKEYNVADEIVKAVKDTGLLLIHLKFSDMEAQRDFGPVRTTIQGDLINTGKKNRLPIPEKIRRLL